MFKEFLDATPHEKAVFLWGWGLRSGDRGVLYAMEDCDASESEWNEVEFYLGCFADAVSEDTRSDEDHQL